jgi:prepilin-type N-terminal cleavage/methylation domain-containing protein
MTNKYTTKAEGFTLVELSIVIIIIGFLIAGIAAGQSLIKQAKLSAIILEGQSHQVEIVAFMNRFNYLPGDLPNAETYWPGETTNGDGNGLANELNTVFPQIVLAGIASYTFIEPIIYGFPISAYSPRSSWAMQGISGFSIYNKTNNNLLFVGENIVNGIVDGSLTAMDALNIDTKVDDGKPDLGKVSSVTRDAITCVVESDGVTPANPINNGYTTGDTILYNLQENRPSCLTYFDLGESGFGS